VPEHVITGLSSVTYVTSAPALFWHQASSRRCGRRLLVQIKQEKKMTKIVLAIVLAVATLAAVPASARPNCQEDLGYGRTGNFGCGG
jgi:hypothetical protein